MQLAKVVGSVVSTQKSASLNLDGSTPHFQENTQEVAVDSMGAGEGELVLVSRGSSARKIFPEPNQAIDLAIVGIVDTIDRF